MHEESVPASPARVLGGAAPNRAASGMIAARFGLSVYEIR